MKKIVKLGEAELRRMIAESIRNMVAESNYDNVKKIYYPLIDNITEFIDCLDKEGYTGDGCDEANSLVERLEAIRNDIQDFFAHPDAGGDKRVWNSVGF